MPTLTQAEKDALAAAVARGEADTSSLNQTQIDALVGNEESYVNLTNIDPSAPLIFTSEMHVKPEFLEEFIPLLRANNAKARILPACRYLYCHQLADDPTTFFLYEAWNSMTEFQEQEMTQLWNAEYIAVRNTMITEDRSLRIWNILEDQ